MFMIFFFRCTCSFFSFSLLIRSDTSTDAQMSFSKIYLYFLFHVERHSCSPRWKKRWNENYGWLLRMKKWWGRLRRVLRWTTQQVTGLPSCGESFSGVCNKKSKNLNKRHFQVLIYIYIISNANHFDYQNIELMQLKLLMY